MLSLAPNKSGARFFSFFFSSSSQSLCAGREGKTAVVIVYASTDLRTPVAGVMASLRKYGKQCLNNRTN